MRRRTPLLVSACAWLFFGACLLAAEPAVDLTVATDRGDATYAVDTPVKFVVTAKQAGQAADIDVVCTIDKDGMPPSDAKTLKLTNGTGTVEGTLGEPGFLRCRVTYGSGAKPAAAAVAVAAIDPLKIPPSLPVPEDFDAFWAQQKIRLADVPVKPILEPVKSPKGIECFHAEIPCVPPRPTTGYFARPAGAAPKSLPAILMVQRAGVYQNKPDDPIGVAKKFHALVLDINAHGLPNKPEAFKEVAGILGDYAALGREDREQSYFLGMYLRLLRGLDFLCAQPEWDGKTLIVRGGSQGGGQAIAAAGLDSRVSFIAANVPAMCDHSGCVIGRASGWPGLVPTGEDGKPDPKVLQVARYFDGMNLVTRAKGEAIFDVGFLDPHCRPTSVYAAYNNWPGTKRIVDRPQAGHRFAPDFGDATIAEHIARMQAGGGP